MNKHKRNATIILISLEITAVVDLLLATYCAASIPASLLLRVLIGMGIWFISLLVIIGVYAIARKINARDK